MPTRTVRRPSVRTHPATNPCETTHFCDDSGVPRRRVPGTRQGTTRIRYTQARCTPDCAKERDAPPHVRQRNKGATVSGLPFLPDEGRGRTPRWSTETVNPSPIVNA